MLFLLLYDEDLHDYFYWARYCDDEDGWKAINRIVGGGGSGYRIIKGEIIKEVRPVEDW